MTVYVSRNATLGQLWRPDLPAPVPPQAEAQARVINPPLLTHVWRQLFDQQARESNRP
ncbi:multiple cyclophane-containing RiPP AmcA [Micromonospora purpureochromogenes]|uniref:multiple cyclophane-containing RiPP AmcA n=1 Tax=Micromonospora purpureochromogenes TaxID=47872 RepID=UPI0036368124